VRHEVMNLLRAVEAFGYNGNNIMSNRPALEPEFALAEIMHFITAAEQRGRKSALEELFKNGAPVISYSESSHIPTEELNVLTSKWYTEGEEVSLPTLNKTYFVKVDVGEKETPLHYYSRAITGIRMSDRNIVAVLMSRELLVSLGVNEFTSATRFLGYHVKESEVPMIEVAHPWGVQE
jgi:hypothetical protein